LYADDVARRKLPVSALVRAGYTVTGVQDGPDAWAALNSDHYDLLIADNDLARLSGLELVKKLRSAQMRLPVILSARAKDVEAVNQHRWLELSATLLKPFTTDRLLEAVRQALPAAPDADSAGHVHVPNLAEALRHVKPSPHWGLND
jgi:DNA-binding NtrC family response regulator